MPRVGEAISAISSVQAQMALFFRLGLSPGRQAWELHCATTKIPLSPALPVSHRHRRQRGNDPLPPSSPVQNAARWRTPNPYMTSRSCTCGRRLGKYRQDCWLRDGRREPVRTGSLERSSFLYEPDSFDTIQYSSPESSL